MDEKRTKILNQLHRLADNKPLKDESIRFKLMGGPYHGMTVRLYGPWDELVWPDGTRYTLHEPLSGKKWIYIHEGADNDT